MAGRRRTDPATVGAGRLPERRDRAEHLAAGATAAGSLTGNGCWLGARAALTFLGFQRRPHMGYPGTVETFSAPQATAADIRTAVPVFILMSDDRFLPLGLRRDMRAVRSLWRRLNRQSRRLRSGEAGQYLPCEACGKYKDYGGGAGFATPSGLRVGGPTGGFHLERCAVIHFRAVSVAAAALIGLAVSTVGFMDTASATPSHWQPLHEEGSEVIEDICPGVNVFWEIVADTTWRYVTRSNDGVPLYEEHVHDNEVYTNLANGESVTVLGTRIEHPLSVTFNGDGTLTYLYNHTGKSVMYAEDGTVVARLFTGGIRLEKTFDYAGTPTDPSDDHLVRLNAPNGLQTTGRHFGPDIPTGFCTALVQAIG